VNRQPEAQNPDDRISDYLALVSKPMKAIPDEARRNFLREVKTHVETLADHYRDEGRDADAAVSDAMRMIGEPVALGRSWAKSWLAANEPGTFLSAFALSAGILVVLQCIFSLLQPAPRPVMFFVNEKIGAMALCQSIAEMAWIPIVLTAVGAVCGWWKPRGASAGLAGSGAIYAAFLFQLFALGGWPASAWILFRQYIATQFPSVASYVTAVLVFALLWVVPPLFLGSALARRERIRRLTRA
jgi:hypothetical protein